MRPHIHRNTRRLRPAIQQRNNQALILHALRIDLRLIFRRRPLQRDGLPEGILIRSDDLLVRQRLEIVLRELGDICADEQRTGRKCPEGKVRAVLEVGQARADELLALAVKADNQHVVVVPVAGARPLCDVVAAVQHVEHVEVVLLPVPGVVEIVGDVLADSGASFLAMQTFSEEMMTERFRLDSRCKTNVRNTQTLLAPSIQNLYPETRTAIDLRLLERPIPRRWPSRSGTRGRRWSDWSR